MQINRKSKQAIATFIVLCVITLPFQNCGKFEVSSSNSSIGTALNSTNSTGGSSTGTAPSSTELDKTKQASCSALLGTPTISITNTSVLNFMSGLNTNSGDSYDPNFSNIFTTTGNKGFTDMTKVNSIGCNFSSIVKTRVIYNSTYKSDILSAIDLLGLIKKSSDLTTDASKAQFADQVLVDFTDLQTNSKNMNPSFSSENTNSNSINSFTRNLIVANERNSARMPLRCVSGDVWLALTSETTITHGAETPFTKTSTPVYAKVHFVNNCPSEAKIYQDGINPNLTTKGALLGSSVAIDANWAVSIAPSQDTNVKGAGVAIVYKNTGNSSSPSWTFSESLKNNSAAAGDNLTAVAIDGSWMAISSEFKSGTGAVFIYNLSGNNWVLTQTLLPSDNESNQVFGHSLAMKAGTLVVGSPQSSLVPGGGELSGAVSIFKLNSMTNQFDFKKRISHSNNSGEGLGMSVSVDGNNLAIGAPQAILTQSSGKGKVYVYNIANPSAPVLTTTILPKSTDITNNGAQFGASVSILGAALAIGSPGATPASDSSKASAGYVCYYDNFTNPNMISTLLFAIVMPVQ